jgi:hypothetical protein
MQQLIFMNDDIYRRPPISFSERLREFSALNAQDSITKSLLSATNTENVTEFLVSVIYDTNFQNRLRDVKIEARDSQILELANALENIVSYGNFRGADLSCQLQYFYHKGYLAQARFGKENSPVIYLKPHYRSRSSEGATNRYSEQDETKNEIMKSLKRLNPRELGETHDSWLRARWD